MSSVDSYDGDEIALQAVSTAVQLRTRELILDTVRRGAVNGTCPVVEIDIDLCALMPVYRTRAALQVVGDEFSLPELADTDSLSVLPGYSDEAWLSFVDHFELDVRYPRHKWKSNGRAQREAGTPFFRFHQLFWTTEWLVEDQPTPGLGAFVHAIERAGGRAVFLSGRWLNEHTEPSIKALRRAGIKEPDLIIGNPWHETLVSEPTTAVSDARIKAWRQALIRKSYGEPVALIDDRHANRKSVAVAIGPGLLQVAAIIPGFTYDPVNAKEPLRLSTFDGFCDVLGSGPSRPHIEHRYPRAGLGRGWRGLYEGLGRNGRSYIVPRLTPPAVGLLSGDGIYTEYVERISPGSLTEGDFLERLEITIPTCERERLHTAFTEAKVFSNQGLADVFPENENEQVGLWQSLVAAWLHSRDVQTLMSAIGFPILATGVHDLIECVAAQEVVDLLIPSEMPHPVQDRERRYSEWLIRWAQTINPSGQVNVGLLNPALTVSLWRWRPDQDRPQDAMDVHRLSDHHQGDQAERYDPIEATVNNLLHQREGMAGVRKEPVLGWAALRARIVRETIAEQIAASSVGRGILRDAANLGQKLEKDGYLTPWGLVIGASFD
jgi:hypothetical protein